MQTNFLNIESIKPSNYDSRRKSVGAVSRKRSPDTQQNMGIKSRRSVDKNYLNNFDNTSTEVIVRRKTRKSTSFGKNVGKGKPFQPGFERYFYRDFTWKIGFSHFFTAEIPLEHTKPLKVYIGRGNNRLLIKSLIKQRPWWTLAEKYDPTCHFVWTQIKIQEIYTTQGKHLGADVNWPLAVFQEHVSKPTNDTKILTAQLESKWNYYFKHHYYGEEKLN